MTTIRKQLAISLLLKSAGLLMSFNLARLQIKCLGLENYGVWTVALSVINWILFFDFGISNGMKNQIAKNIKEHDNEKLKEIVSTGYFSIFILLIFFVAFIYITSFIVDYPSLILNEANLNHDSRLAIYISSVFVVLNFFFGAVNQIANACQKSYVSNLNQFLVGIVLNLIFALLTTKITLIQMSYLWGGVILFVNIIISVCFFLREKVLTPNYKYIKIAEISSLLSLSGKIFILQIIILFIFSTDRVLLTKFLSATDAAIYDIYYRIFSVIVIFNGMVMSPVWPKITTIMTTKNKMDDLYRIISFLKKLIILYVFVDVFLVLLTPYIINFFIKDNDFKINQVDIFLMGLMVIVFILYTILSQVSNGLEVFEGQLIFGGIGAVINIPLSYYLSVVLNFGLGGILTATTISLLLYCIYSPFEIKRKIAWSSYA